MTAAAEVKAPQTLDELMLAMDVVDTIRHRELVVERELSQGDRDEALRARLREIYHSQGIEVTDVVIDQGIKALRESRFAYTPPAPSLARTLALFWVRRRLIGAWVGGILISITALWGVAYYGIDLPRERAQQEAQADLSDRLPKALTQAAGAARVETKDAAVLSQIDGLESDGKAALAKSDADGARAAIASLDGLRGRLVQTYSVNVISRPDETSGVWRESLTNPGSRNYYLVVEAVTPNGEILSLPITNEETGKVSIVSKWGVRVPASFFEAVKRDKLDNGIVEQNPIGKKSRGELDPHYVFAKEGGAITSWDE
ncbi:MAG: DUF6384 family protein [Micropepsaceae bacterium]